MKQSFMILLAASFLHAVLLAVSKYFAACQSAVAATMKHAACKKDAASSIACKKDAASSNMKLCQYKMLSFTALS